MAALLQETIIGFDKLQEQQQVMIVLLQEIEASLEQFRMARGRRQLGNRLQDILARHIPSSFQSHRS